MSISVEITTGEVHDAMVDFINHPFCGDDDCLETVEFFGDTSLRLVRGDGTSYIVTVEAE